MKTSKTPAKTENHNGRACATTAPTPAAILHPQLPQDSVFAAHRAKCQALQNERAAALLSGLDIVFAYSERGHIGIGYKPDGQLVEFGIPRAGGQEDIENTHWMHAISLAESIDWVRQMEFAARRLDMCCQQEGDGYLRWLHDLRVATA